jgi:hypothetical protein
MSAIETLQAARRIGVKLDLDGNDLILEASEEPPADVLEAVKEQKPAIIALLRRQRHDWSSEDWLAFFHERAGNAGAAGLSPEQADAVAFQHCIEEWLKRNPSRSLPGRCAWCGHAQNADATIVPLDALLPFGTDSTGHSWLHAGCHAAW